MDYEVGSIADLISGNHTPNRRKVIKKPLTPVKIPPSSNVTPSIPENVKARTPKLAFTPETTIKSSSKSKIPVNEFDSPKSVPKKRKSKLFNNFQFLSQLPDHPDSENEVSGEGEGSENDENEGFSEKKKKKKYSKEDAKKVVKEYYIGKDELNSSADKPKKEKDKNKNSNKEQEGKLTKQKKVSSIYDELGEDEPDKKSKKKKKKNEDFNEEINDNNKEGKLLKQKKASSIYDELVEDEPDKKSKKKKRKNEEINDNNKEGKLLKQKRASNIYDELVEDEPDKKSKKKKRKNKDLNENIDDNLNKKNKRKSESDFSAESNDESINKNGDLSASENEMDTQEANDDVVDSGEEDDRPKTDFQKAAARRVEKKLLKDEKFSAEETERTLFVGNIPVSVLQKNHEKVLRHKFSPYGGIESVRIRNIPLADFKTKPKVALIEKKFHAERTTVIAYIKFRNAASVGKALVENNSLMEGNHLRVDKCFVDRKVQVDSRKTVFLGNLPFNIEEETVRSIFKNCGNIVSVRIVRDRQTQIGKGIGFINFEKSDGVELAVSMSEEDLQIKNKTIRVQRYNASNNRKKESNNTKNNPRDNNRVVGKRYQKFNQPVDNGPQRPFNRKRDAQGNKKRKRDQDGKYINKPRWNNQNEGEGNQNDHSAAKKLKQTAELDGNVNDHSGDGAPAKVTEVTTQNTTEGSTEVTKQSRKERGIEFKGLIAKKKKKLKLDKALLKKKKISKILLHEVKKSQ